MSYISIQRRHERLRRAICRLIEKAVRRHSRITGGPLHYILRKPVPLDYPALDSNRTITTVGVSTLHGLAAEVHNRLENRKYMLPLDHIPTEVLIKILAKLD